MALITPADAQKLKRLSHTNAVQPLFHCCQMQRLVDEGEENEWWMLRHEEKHVFPSSDRRDFLFMTFVTGPVYSTNTRQNTSTNMKRFIVKK